MEEFMFGVVIDGELDPYLYEFRHNAYDRAAEARQGGAKARVILIPRAMLSTDGKIKG